MKANKFLFIAIITCILSGINICVNTNSTKENSDLLLENINAIAYGESFSWDGREWNDTNTDNWFGSNWKPVLVNCTVTIGLPGYQITYEGKKVTCNNGNGNCLMASDCTNS